MSIVRKIGAVVAAPLLTYGVFLGITALVTPHNTYEFEGGEHIYTKVDGVFAITKVVLDAEGGVQVVRDGRLGPFSWYSDDDLDGKVDAFFIGADSDSDIVYRDLDYSRFQVQFDSADYLVQEQLDRFRGLIHRSKS